MIYIFDLVTSSLVYKAVLGTKNYTYELVNI